MDAPESIGEGGGEEAVGTLVDALRNMGAGGGAGGPQLDSLDGTRGGGGGGGGGKGV